MFFSVTDNGPGITKNDKIKLFNAFSQINVEKISDGNVGFGLGFGLGLSFCKNIIKLHGGSIYVHSVEGKGATFKFSVPIKKFEYDENNNQNNNSSSKLIGYTINNNNNNNNNSNSLVENNSNIMNSSIIVEHSSNSSKISNNSISHKSQDVFTSENMHGNFIKTHNNVSRRNEISESNCPPIVYNSFHEISTSKKSSNTTKIDVLIVDDSEVNRKMLRYLLLSLNYDSEEAENGEEALKLIEKKIQPYKIIFMDGSMPIMDGITCVKKLRELNYDSLIVGLTGNILEDDLNGFMTAGVNYVFKKPISKERIIKLISFVKKNQEIVGAQQIVETKNSFKLLL